LASDVIFSKSMGKSKLSLDASRLLIYYCTERLWVRRRSPLACD